MLRNFVTEPLQPITELSDDGTISFAGLKFRTFKTLTGISIKLETKLFNSHFTIQRHCSVLFNGSFELNSNVDNFIISMNCNESDEDIINGEGDVIINGKTYKNVFKFDRLNNILLGKLYLSEDVVIDYNNTNEIEISTLIKSYDSVTIKNGLIFFDNNMSYPLAPFTNQWFGNNLFRIHDLQDFTMDFVIDDYFYTYQEDSDSVKVSLRMQDVVYSDIYKNNEKLALKFELGIENSYIVLYTEDYIIFKHKAYEVYCNHQGALEEQFKYGNELQEYIQTLEDFKEYLAYVPRKYHYY
jgi:hypothetical protein